MAPALNHTIVHVRDRRAAAREVASVLGLPEPKEWGPFAILELGNGVSLDFANHDDPTSQHYAFLVTEEEFDGVLARVLGRGLQIWADPRQKRPGEINVNDGGRGFYWPGPDGHWLEAMTRPYGG
jgi:catechol 2,3-dioxygenase-like lactoylglutathione lyase family enzyme